MERKILFKAKRLDNGEWVEGYYYKECDNTYIIEDRQKESMLNRNEAVLVDHSTVCQFTGLKDKNGVEIWEHDFISSPLGNSSEVVFLRGTFAIRVDGGIIHLASLSTKYAKNYGSKFDRKEGEK